MDHYDKPIVIDLSPPEAGQVLDGDNPHGDRVYQASTTEICANWKGFFDPQSGICK